MKRLKELRLIAGYSQRYVAENLGITQQAYANYESGKREPDNNTLIRLADFFGVTVGYLLGTEEPGTKKAPHIEVRSENGTIMQLDEETLAIIDTLRSRPEMRMLFSVSSKATKDDIIKAVKIIEALKDESETDSE